MSLGGGLALHMGGNTRLRHYRGNLDPLKGVSMYE